jgi:hypothetical protein
MHGSHKSKNVLSGSDHPQYRHGGETKAARKAHQETLLRLAYLVAIGEHIKMFAGPRNRGRKPTGYNKLNLNDPENMATAILNSGGKNFTKV